MILFGTGFRPFFLVGSAFGAVAMLVWALVLGGQVQLGGPLVGTAWHAHEMLVGFTTAVVAGFLLTAVQNWTGQTTARGPALAALFALWCAGRVAASVDLGWPGLVVDVAFLPVLAAVVARPLIKTNNRRNLPFAPVLVFMALADLAAHLGWLTPSQAMGLVLDSVLVILAIVGGRIVPLFTRNAIPASGARRVLVVDRVALGLLWALLFVDALAIVAPVELVVAGVAVAAGVAQAVRMGTWGSLATLRSPILWILHLGYAWIAVGLVLRGAIGLGAPLPTSAATHALTVGAIATFTVGMMSRVSLGHTGRRLILHPVMVAGYLLVVGASVVRVGGLLVGGGPWYWTLAASLLAGALFVFVAVYARILLTPRADGKSG